MISLVCPNCKSINIVPNRSDKVEEGWADFVCTTCGTLLRLSDVKFTLFSMKGLEKVQEAANNAQIPKNK